MSERQPITAAECVAELVDLVIAALTAAMTDDQLRDRARLWRESLGDLGDDMACVLEGVIDRREALARSRERAS